jgi:hypothetical protein
MLTYAGVRGGNNLLAVAAVLLLLPALAFAEGRYDNLPPQVVASVAYEGQTAPINITKVYTTCRAGLFRVSVYLETSDPDAGISDFVVGGFGWQDDYNIHPLTLNPFRTDLEFALGAPPTSNQFGGPDGETSPVTIRMAPHSSLTFATFSGDTTSPLATPYNLYIVVEALRSHRYHREESDR